MTTTTPASQPQRLLDRLTPVLDELAALLDAIGTEHDDAPTPCHEYRVRDLRQHVVGWLTSFADGFDSADGTCSDADAVVVDGNGAAQVRERAVRIRAAVAGGALERPVVIGGAGLPGEVALGMMLGEYQVHGWDLARATGRTWDADDEGLEMSIALFEQMLTPEMRGEGRSFGEAVPVPADAPALDRLVGLTGRDPAWSAN
ncbi:TIGR03086 family protein [Pseudoclavibacter endophyticus]|uniref:TIGR03086 family protein n=1 Tax=Pseudoclavibacter endophyticus TaxID=1778590 RepID=A0A6H9WLA8_9MICO|nr:TIGR03086 family metal-binding protein [Pseudoclavibacter endophyticus]KAB1649606.1 TIGR03086 family protein [Pseudoclavibacter endophyticus]GGA61270.1 TIGR03086 family protein [Pseudoclavibacter endophyticus]